MSLDEDQDNDVPIGAEEGIEDDIQHQLEAHIAGLKSVEDKEDGEVDNSTGTAIVSDDSNNVAEQFDVDIPSSDTFVKLNIVLQETTYLWDVLIETAKLMSMLTLGYDKGSIDISGKFKSRSERWFGKMIVEDELNED